MKDFPGILVLCNECFSDSSSNGRTLRNYFAGWPAEKLAQFYIHGADPDPVVCHRYYCVSDGAALRSFLHGKPASGEQNMQRNPGPQVRQSGRKAKRDAVSMTIRNIVWNSMRWAGASFYEWVEDFAPELILLQAGDSAFMFRLARKLAQRYGVPLVIYNSEAYYFKTFDYFRSSGVAKMLYPLFHRAFCREFEKTIKMAACSVYGCDKLKRDYDAVFGLPSHVVFTASELTPAEKKSNSGLLRISYLGNLGLGRHVGLLEIGNALQELSPRLHLDVYGKLPNEEVVQAFENGKGIRYCGFVSYEEVRRVIADSDILVHTESFEPFYKEDLKYAFSTKLADSLASGRCFLLYAPEKMACTEYLKDNQAAWVVERKEELLPVLRRLAEDVTERERYTDAAWNLVLQNHSMEKSAQRFQQLLRECAEGVL